MKDARLTRGEATIGPNARLRARAVLGGRTSMDDVTQWTRMAPRKVQTSGLGLKVERCARNHNVWYGECDDREVRIIVFATIVGGLLDLNHTRRVKHF